MGFSMKSNSSGLFDQKNMILPWIILLSSFPGAPFSLHWWIFLTCFCLCSHNVMNPVWRMCCLSQTVYWRPLGMPRQIATTTPAASASTWTSTSTSTGIPLEGTSTTTCWRRWGREWAGGLIQQKGICFGLCWGVESRPWGKVQKNFHS